ncbi:MAG: DUF1127 domain-containing protein [Tranquillimonas sp.]|jgi:uncharacterized protein YjiS (DUF1127 family)
MTVYTTNNAAARRPRFNIARLRSFLADPFGFTTGLRAYRTYLALDALSDRELADLGLERANVARAAMDAAFAEKDAR